MVQGFKMLRPSHKVMMALKMKLKKFTAQLSSVSDKSLAETMNMMKDVKRFRRFFVLALQWGPSMNSSNKKLTIHGGWPNLTAAETILAKKIYSANAQSRFSDSSFSEKNYQGMELDWPNLSGDGTWEKHCRFWAYEFLTHGFVTGVSQRRYFEAIRKSYHKIPNDALRKQVKEKCNGNLWEM